MPHRLATTLPSCAASLPPPAAGAGPAASASDPIDVAFYDTRRNANVDGMLKAAALLNSSRVRLHPSSRLPDASSNSSVTPSRTAGCSPCAARTQACSESWPDGSGLGNGWRSASEVQLSAVQLSERPELPLRAAFAWGFATPQEGDVQA